MSLLPYRTRPDLRAGFVLVMVFALGMAGASLAAARNGGHVPYAAEPSVQLAKLIAPL
jgi:hypothetical protein